MSKPMNRAEVEEMRELNPAQCYCSEIGRLIATIDSLRMENRQLRNALHDWGREPLAESAAKRADELRDEREGT